MRRLLLVSFVSAFAALTPQYALSQINTRGITTDLTSTSDRFTPLDINGDGKMDMLYSRPGGGYAGVYISHGDGTFRYVAYTNNGSTTSAGFTGDLESAADTFVPLDINGDGKSDFLSFRPGHGYASECLSLGDGRVNCLPLSSPNGQSNGMLDNFQNGNERIIAADLNGDGKSDFILWTRTTGYARAYLSNGDGTFKAVNYAVGGSPMNGFVDTMKNGDENFVAVDLNGDGKSDIVFSSPSHGVVRTFLANSNGSGTLSPPTTLADSGGDYNGFSGNAKDGSGRALALDFNGDGKGDFLWYEPGNGFAAVYVSNYPSSGGVSQYLLRQGSTQHGFQGDLSSGADTALILDFNGDGKSDFLFSRPGSGYVTLYVSNGTSANLTAYDYANAGNSALGFVNNAESGNDTAIALNFLGQKNSGFLWYSPGNGIAPMNAYTQSPAGTPGQLSDYSFHAYPATFLSDLKWSLANVPLKEIVMPGTHDSAMYNLQGGYADLSETQLGDFPTQFSYGARAIDFRVGYFLFEGGSLFRIDGEDSLGHIGVNNAYPLPVACDTDTQILSAGFFMYGHSDVCTDYSALSEINAIEDWLTSNPNEVVVLTVSEVFNTQYDFFPNMNAPSMFISNVLQASDHPSLIYTQQSACGVPDSTPNYSCSLSSAFPPNVTPAQLISKGRRLILLDVGDGSIAPTGWGWSNAYSYDGYCSAPYGQGGIDDPQDEIQCLNNGFYNTTNGIQQDRPPYRAADANTGFLDTKAALTPLGYPIPLSGEPIYYALGSLPNEDNGFNNGADTWDLRTQIENGLWAPNALNLWNYDGILPDGFTQDLILQNNQTWISAEFASAQVPLQAVAVSIGTDGTVWAAPAPGGHALGLFKYTAASGRWAAVIPNQTDVLRLAGDNKGGVYVAGSLGSTYGELFHYNSNGQGEYTGSVVHDVAVGADGSVWCIGENGALFNLVAPSTGLTPNVSPITGTRVAVANNGYPIVVQTTGVVAMWNGSEWVQQSFSASEVAAAADGSLFIVGTNPKAVGRYNPGSGQIDYLHMDAVHVAVDPTGHPWAIRNGTNLLYKGALDQTN